MTPGDAAVWGAASYERIAETFAPIHERIVGELDLRPGTRLLDIGCGTGAVAIRAARAGADVVGLDLAPGQLEKARAAAAAEGVEVRFDEGDCQALPYADGSFDAVVSVFALIFAPDQRRAASEAARVCRLGGRLVLTAWHDDDWTRLAQRIGRLIPEAADAAAWGEERHVRELLGDAFELRFDHGEWLVEAESPEALWELFSTSVPHLKAWLDSLDAGRRAEARRAHLEFFAGGTFRRDYLLVLGTRR